mmetsp:Transcript_47706/g.94143  ORF Transcript_47706/g.94143 Transcript_47706/m.94143 type:complete len:211 (+) Transcript_47706:1043-1675(+)
MGRRHLHLRQHPHLPTRLLPPHPLPLRLQQPPQVAAVQLRPHLRQPQQGCLLRNKQQRPQRVPVGLPLLQQRTRRVQGLVSLPRRRQLRRARKRRRSAKRLRKRRRKRRRRNGFRNWNGRERRQRRHCRQLPSQGCGTSSTTSTARGSGTLSTFVYELLPKRTLTSRNLGESRLSGPGLQASGPEQVVLPDKHRHRLPPGVQVLLATSQR